MGLPCLLRGPRRWNLLIAVAGAALAFHTFSHLFPESPYNYRQYAPQDAWRWGPRVKSEQPFHLHANTPFQKQEEETIPSMITQNPFDLQLAPDVSTTASTTTASSTTPSSTTPSQTPEPTNHHVPSADDFLPTFAALSQTENLTVDTAMGTCQYTPSELKQFGYGTDHPWVHTHIPTSDIASQRTKWQSFVANDMVPWTLASNTSSGRGIVVVAGHPMAMKRFRVLVRALRDLGSKVPVELAYYGAEVNGSTKAALTAEFPNLALYFNDLSAPEQVYTSPRAYTADIHINFQLKLAALLNSRFAEPLLLDSDNIPASDPVSLWTSPTYERHGTIFWPDIVRMRPENPMYAITNTPCARDEYELESGQLLVDKRRFWYHLQLADYFIGEEWYKDFLLGDKDTFRFAWNALNTEYGRPKKWLTSVGVVVPQALNPWNAAESALLADGEERETVGEVDRQEVVYEFCGHTFAQHHPDSGEVMFMHGGTLKSFGAPLLKLLKGREGVYVAYKRSGLDERWGDVEQGVHLKYMSAGFVYKHAGLQVGGGGGGLAGSVGGSNRQSGSAGGSNTNIIPSDVTDTDMAAVFMCTDFQRVVSAPVRDIGQAGFEKAFERAGGYWGVEEGYRPGVSGA